MPRPVTEPCGTSAAYLRHIRRGEQACEDCRHANNRDKRERYRAANPLPQPETKGMDWHADAACLGVDSEVFIHHGTHKMVPPCHRCDEAKAICNTCSVQEDCLAWAMEQRFPYGVFGGLTDHERMRLRKRGQEAVRRARRGL